MILIVYASSAGWNRRRTNTADIAFRFLLVKKKHWNESNVFFVSEIRNGLEFDFVEFGVSLFSSGANLFGFFLLFLLFEHLDVFRDEV